jgi:uncharacterized protein YciI
MKRLFAVTRSHGDAWQPLLPLEEQEAWSAHAAFMDALEAEGFVALGGPLEGTGEALLIVRAETAAEIVERLEADPWTGLDLLRTSRVAPWTLRLGRLAPDA